MSRDDGFPRADMDTAYLEDAKWKRAWRALGDPERMAQATCLHLSTVLASWRHGERVPVTDAAPMWLALDESVIEVLVKVGLLDADGCIPAESFDAWYGPAARRSKAATEGGKEGNRRRWGGTASGTDRQPIATQSAANPLPHLPQTPTTPTSTLPARELAPTSMDGWPNLDTDAIAALEARTGGTWSQAGDKQLLEFDRLIGAHGLPRVLEAFDAISRGQRMTARQLVWPAVKALEPFADATFATERLKPERAPRTPRPPVPDKAAVDAELRKLYGLDA